MSADAWLLARRITEERTGPFTAAEYGQAASALRQLGHHAEASALDELARTGAAIEEAEREWRGRYRDRAPTLAEQRDAELLRTGRVRQLDSGMTVGIDGMVYTPAVLTGPAGATVPVIVAATHAGTVEVITGFRTEREQEDWLADRARQSSGTGGRAAPLAACSSGPPCRLALEEQVLAALLTRGDPGGVITGQLTPTVFSAHTRYEAYLAFLGANPSGAPDPEEIRARLSARLLRAPDWAASYVGRPCGHLALAYADRLAATPVTTAEAKAAVAGLVRETGQAVVHADENPARRSRYSSRSRPIAAHGQPEPVPARLQRPADIPVPGVVPRM